jgi:hypothetical protein
MSQTTPTPGAEQHADAIPVPTPYQITQQLTANAIEAVNALSVHLQKVPDKTRMYKANQALHALWEIE